MSQTPVIGAQSFTSGTQVEVDLSDSATVIAAPAGETTDPRHTWVRYGDGRTEQVPTHKLMHTQTMRFVEDPNSPLRPL